MKAPGTGRLHVYRKKILPQPATIHAMYPTVAIFDSGGVLHESIRTSEVIARALGTDKSTMSEIWKAHLDKLSLGQIDEATFWDLAHQDFGVRLPSPNEQLLEQGFVPPKAGPTPAVFAVVHRLRALGLRLATIAPHARALRYNGVYSGFDEVVLSFEVGLQKPDPVIYQLTLDRLGVTADQAIFIDDLEQNVEAASRLGMHGILFTGAPDLESILKIMLPDYARAR